MSSPEKPAIPTQENPPEVAYRILENFDDIVSCRPIWMPDYVPRGMRSNIFKVDSKIVIASAADDDFLIDRKSVDDFRPRLDGRIWAPSGAVHHGIGSLSVPEISQDVFLIGRTVSAGDTVNANVIPAIFSVTSEGPTLGFDLPFRRKQAPSIELTYKEHRLTVLSGWLEKIIEQRTQAEAKAGAT